VVASGPKISIEEAGRAGRREAMEVQMLAGKGIDGRMLRGALAGSRWWLVPGALLLCGGTNVTAADDAKPETRAPVVEVVGTTPLPGVGTPLNEVPANVYSAPGEAIERQDPLTLGGFLDRNVGSVNVNESQSNPFQPDVNFRGFAASAVLGQPQGMSVFQDGVRINDPFGDTVNWDLIPLSAISGIHLIPGSNPVFGLNTLGGALAVATKSGFENPGFAAQVLGGSFGRLGAEFEAGGSRDQVGYFLTYNFLQDQGWRDFSPSHVRQLFGKLGYREGGTEANLSYTWADNSLSGTQALPVSMLGNPKQPYTWPDTNTNLLNFFNLSASHAVSDTLLVSANAYYRRLFQTGFNSNVNDNFDPALPAGPGNAEASNIYSSTGQDGYGGSLQYTFLGDLAGFRNQLIAGVSYDGGSTDFTQQSQEATITPNRATFGISGLELTTLARTTNDYYGFYLADVFSLNEQWTMTLAGRYNVAKLSIEDLSGLSPALNSNQRFSRFNPAAGLNFNPNASLTIYGSYNEGMRAPTPIELTCADPAAPCTLPNAFLSDPPLQPVIAKTWEAGARGTYAGMLQWSAALYHTDLNNDIQFISSGGAALNAGFFQNVGNTRRQGIELGASARLHWLTLTASYAYIDATFQSQFVERSPNNSSADANGDILVRPGDRIPGIPNSNLKLRAEFPIGDRFSIGVNMVAASSQYPRGDENNLDIRGQVPGYAVFNLDASYRLAPGWEVFANVNNLFDRNYQTFGILGENVFTGPFNTFDPANAVPEQFRSPGAPFGIWVGIRFLSDDKRKAPTAAFDRD
jgi:iron complex outermembrane recepter protein